MRDKICIACGKALPKRPLIVLDGMPASAQDIPDAEGKNEDKGISLHLHQCEFCGLVQFDCEPVGYYKDVIRSGGFSTTMVNLRRRQYGTLIEKYHLKGKKFIEAGCGQGEFLSVLTEFPVEAYGIEHKADLVELAKSRGLKVWRQFTEDENTVLENTEDGCHGPYDVFLSFNFLEHQAHPVRMLKCLYNNLTEGGLGLLTVPSLEYILKYDGYYELIRDHLAYYTFDTLRFVLAEAGFEVLEEEMVNRDTLSVVVRKRPAAGASGIDAGTRTAGKNENMEDAGKTAETAEMAAARVMGTAGKYSEISSVFEAITGFAESRQELNLEVERILNQFDETGRTLAIWGASHQGFTLAATTGLKDRAKYMIDSAPFKQGRFAPASHIPIVAPDHFEKEPVDGILIVAPGYTEEIAGIIRERFGSNVEIMTLRSRHIEKKL